MRIPTALLALTRGTPRRQLLVRMASTNTVSENQFAAHRSDLLYRRLG
jgi:hypothetical protein